MSEEERIRRFRYRQTRKQRTKTLLRTLIVLLTLTILLSIAATLFNNTYYVNYTEKSSVNYGVHLKDNSYYDETYLNEGYSYIASLINTVEACFNYGIVMDTKSDVSFKYTYRIDSVVEIKDSTNGKILFAPVYNEIPETSNTLVGDSVNLKQTVFLDYDKYNQLAESFIETYQLNSVGATLHLQMHVCVVGASEEFDAKENTSSYVSSLSIPLVKNTLAVSITSAQPAENQKILSYTTKDIAQVFKTCALSFAAATVAVGIALALYAYLSRNYDVTYDIKVSRLVSAYKSYIQRLQNEFNTSGYQVLMLTTFNEMLEIRDTIQSPILMFENIDKTCSRFFIPTNTNIVYLFEIKVDDYNKIYGIEEYAGEEETVLEVEEKAEEETVLEVEEKAEEVIIPEPETVEETVAPASEPATPTAIDMSHIVELEKTGEDDEDAAIAYIDEFGNIIEITCARSFTANLIQSNPQVKYYYNELKNHILAYKGVKSRISWRLESFNSGRAQLFKMKIRGKTICLYCALDPAEFDTAKYFHESVTAKTFAKVPMMVRIKSDRGLKRAKTLIDTVMTNFGIVPKTNAETVDYAAEYPYDSTKNLVERGLIKILIPGATASEPKEHHHAHKKTFEVVAEDKIEEIVIFEAEGITEEDIKEVIEAPTPELDAIDYDDASEEVTDFVETAEHPGVDVIGVVWPERAHKNKIYRYDPDGETVATGDVVLVPTRDVHRDREVIRKAAVAHPNHKVDPEDIKVPLKKIIGVMHKKNLEESAETVTK